ncbi:2-octaprenyl-6-methoxyphenyl hydroxylase [[Actinobacillus] muris]|uniref:2-octaprenyl-6-methoxyphenyl hydroxylase n=1 Tax=Muribacter muris TaxID=67855 RepID=A0A0J5P733_9PAST|nr:2-octaprenyl-6-methoxyphenyl hydroxylase [Muribacter muris]KMK51259.1 2-octaprenyl-6-methoxyphenyl hydroxylase [[Actinobacillus] muris] [Muribacter muris]
MQQQFDAVIVGGAVTGSVLALALSSASGHKMRVAIIEKQLPDYQQQGGFDARSIALAYGSLQKMAKIRPLGSDNLAALAAKLATPIKQIQVSDQHHFGKTTLRADELKLDNFGVVVELATLGETLAKAIAQHHNIRLFCPDTVQSLTRTAEKCTLKLASGELLDTPLLIAADGIQSRIAQMCGVETVCMKDYRQSAVIANVELAEPHHNQAFERFTAQGPFALLPLAERTMSLVWCVQQPDEIMAYADAQFLRALQQQFGWRLGKFLRVSKRFVYPLSSQKATSHIHHRLAIVGNAAQLLHPVAGQGFNLGMRDLFSLAELVTQAFQTGQDLGGISLLSEFERRRQADQTRIMRSTSALISLFCHDTLPVQILRNLGLLTLSHCRGAREQVAHQALGW